MPPVSTKQQEFFLELYDDEKLIVAVRCKSVLNIRATSLYKCAAVPRQARISGS
jgi:hypothetical protein